MARGRMISKELGSSRRFAALGTTDHGEFAQCLYQLVLTWSDDFGRSSGDAFTVKHRVFPTNARDEASFESALVQMEGVGLIRRWIASDQHVLEVVNFDDHQNGLHKRTRSKLPDAPGKTHQPSTSPTQDRAHDASSVTSDRVSQLLEHYPSQYLALTGQPYVQSRMQQGKDLEAAEALCRAYDDDALQKIVKTYLQVDEENPKATLIRGSQRTLPKLVTMAGSLASALKLRGATHE